MAGLAFICPRRSEDGQSTPDVLAQVTVSGFMRICRADTGLAIVVSTYEPMRTLPLYRDVLTDATFHQLLLACDRDLRS